ncbi:MAG: arylsulfatase A-like enzyme [Candidatus Aldehydirespiratoraceae bacterium]|jgi:arylsulfatase A-like enzyme
MWFPIDHPTYQADHPEDAERFDTLPANFHDHLHTKPEIQRAWRQVRNHEHFVGTTEELGIYDDTVIAYTSDHGDACGSHGLRARLPCVYGEVMGVPMVIKAPSITQPGTTTDALATHVDPAATLCSLGDVDLDETPTLSGVDLTPALADTTVAPRDYVFFSQDSAQSSLIQDRRYALRGFFDGTTKYARYYGISGGVGRDGKPNRKPKLFDVDATFEDHEWYEVNDDPHELVNLANDRGRRDQLRTNFNRLLEIEAAELGAN